MLHLQPKVQPSPFLQSEAQSPEAEEPAPPLQKDISARPAPRLQYRHSTGSGMEPMEKSALQAGLKTMPHRIPPLPEIPLHEVPPFFSLLTCLHEQASLAARHCTPTHLSTGSQCAYPEHQTVVIACLTAPALMIRGIISYHRTLAGWRG